MASFEIFEVVIVLLIIYVTYCRFLVLTAAYVRKRLYVHLHTFCNIFAIFFCKYIILYSNIDQILFFKQNQFFKLIFVLRTTLPLLFLFEPIIQCHHIFINNVLSNKYFIRV